ncbi:hypothetical protein ABBQ32_000642 [Trebouxia sp. C0010 RCD-2024]
MTGRSVLQACDLADRLLTPLEETLASVSGVPVDAQGNLDCQVEARAASDFERLLGVVLTIAPRTLQNTAPSPDPTWSAASTVEEVSDQQAELHAEQLLVVKSCQAAALYAADTALLTTWSSHRLSVAARGVLKQLCAAMPMAVVAPAQTASPQPDEQDLIAAIMPAVLPRLSPALMFQGTHSSTQGPDAFTRCLAGRQLAFLLRQLDYRHLTGLLPSALPYVLAIVKDPSRDLKDRWLRPCQGLTSNPIYRGVTLMFLLV